MPDLASQLDALGADGCLAAGSVLQADASSLGNDVSLEFLWAEKAQKYSDMHMKLLRFIDPSTIKLSRFDDYINRLFMRYFKNMNIEVIKEDNLKSDTAKQIWRPFCEHFKGALNDYNFGTMLRLDCRKDYSSENCILVTRIQFLAIEIVRNRKGLNKFHLTDTSSDVTGKMNNLNTNGSS